MAEPIIRAGAVDRVLAAEEVADALLAWFSPCDILECAELQFHLGELLDRVLRSSGTKMGNIQLLDSATESLHIVVHRGLDKASLDRFATVRKTEETACARALRFRHRVVIEDVQADAQFRPYLEAAGSAGFRAVQSTPLFAMHAQIAGVLSTHYPYPHVVDPAEARSIDEAALQARPLMSRFQGMG